MAWRKSPADALPGPLLEFREADWPPVPGECLEVYTCRADGYEARCAPGPEGCGAAFLASLDDPRQVAEWRRRHAQRRWRQARMSWLGEGHPGWLDEWLDYLGEL